MCVQQTPTQRLQGALQMDPHSIMLPAAEQMEVKNLLKGKIADRYWREKRGVDPPAHSRSLVIFFSWHLPFFSPLDVCHKLVLHLFSLLL